jgi:hypothetical protein
MCKSSNCFGRPDTDRGDFGFECDSTVMGCDPLLDGGAGRYGGRPITCFTILGGKIGGCPS